MHVGRSVLPTYEQSCANAEQQSLFAKLLDAFKDPVLVLITLAAVIGSFCLLSGLYLLCVVSQTLQDQMSEAILLLGMGFFISSIACVAWKLTSVSRITRIIEAIKEEAV